MKSVELNENGYVEQAFFTDLKAVKLVRRTSGRYHLVVFNTDGSEFCFQIETKSPNQFPVFIKQQENGE